MQQLSTEKYEIIVRKLRQRIKEIEQETPKNEKEKIMQKTSLEGLGKKIEKIEEMLLQQMQEDER